ncbi:MULTISPECIES: hypothetical protein [Methylosinus]|nr:MULTISPECIES: hypothetical protein [Methylosinus]
MTDQSETFPPRVICRVLDIPQGTLATWADRGYFANFDAAFAERGKARLFSRKDVLALALIKCASTYGVLTSEISSFAPMAAEAVLHYGPNIRELIIRQYEGESSATSIRYNDDVMADPPEADAVVTISLNLTHIFNKAMKALDQEVANRAASIKMETRLEEVDPTLTSISRVFKG